MACRLLLSFFSQNGFAVTTLKANSKAWIGLFLELCRHLSHFIFALHERCQRESLSHVAVILEHTEWLKSKKDIYIFCPHQCCWLNRISLNSSVTSQHWWRIPTGGNSRILCLFERESMHSITQSFQTLSNSNYKRTEQRVDKQA